jgi:hypothetical protein
VTKIGSASFLKKRSKKLLLTAGRGISASKSPRNGSFFASFFSKKEALPFNLASMLSLVNEEVFLA